MSGDVRFRNGLGWFLGRIGISCSKNCFFSESVSWKSASDLTASNKSSRSSSLNVAYGSIWGKG